jgi:enoyl-CoA hydratase/carnithine racemase
MILSGDHISAQQAYEWGYFDEVVPPEKLEETTMAWVKKLASKSPIALKLVKRLFFDTQDMPPRQAWPYIEEVFCRHLASEAGQTAIRAFVEKKKPPWLIDMDYGD